jgi:hypothetical protein
VSNGTPQNYGFGLMYGEYRGVPIVHHNGSQQGYRAQFIRFPKQRFSVAVLCNLGAINPDPMVRRIADIYLEKELPPREPQPLTMPVEATIDPSLLDGYVGKFAADANPRMVMTITREGDNLYAQPTGQQRLQIFPSSENEFFLKAANARMTFHREPDGTTNRITIHQNGDRGASRVQDFSVSSADLQQYTGKFYSNELDVTFEIVAQGSGLSARARRLPDVTLQPIRSDVFSFGASLVNFRRNAKGQIEALSYGGGRVLNVIFVKQP